MEEREWVEGMGKIGESEIEKKENKCQKVRRMAGREGEREREREKAR